MKLARKNARQRRPALETLEGRWVPSAFTQVNFDNYVIQPYGGSGQDITGPVAIEDAGATLHLTGNRWKKIALPYQITPDTVLEFSFKSTRQGEIHGIGFDTDDIQDPARTFQLYGTQGFGLGAFRNYASSAPGWKSYQIPVGQYYTGAMNYLTFLMDNDINNSSADAFFKDIRVYDQTDFADVAIRSYGGPGQDKVGPVTVEDAGATLHLVGNRWKAIDLPYNVTTDTVLEFDFKSTRQGEIHGIGLDNDLTPSPDRVFQLYGTQGYGLDAFKNYSGSAPGWKHYAIPVGRFFQGPAAYLTFVMDNDVNNSSADAFFKNVRVYEKQPFGVGGGLGVSAGDFRVTTFASGLNYPTGMQELDDGSILVGTSRPNPGGNLFNSVGELIRLVDANNDGHADGPGTVLYTGLPGAVTGVKKAGNLVFVTSAAGGQERISVLRVGASPSSRLTLVGSLRFGFPAGWEHISYTTAVRPTPGDPSRVDLFFNIGSQFNYDPTTSTVALSGLISGTLQGESIYKVTVQDTGGSPVVTNLVQIAKGLRNAAGIAFRPSNGDLYLEDNGIDGLDDRNEPLSADELNRIAASQIGGTVEDFGFSRDYIEYRTGRRVGSGAVQPVAAFQPIPNPTNGSESEGPSEIAFAPSGFPSAVNNGVFIGFHGKFSQGGLANEENPLVYYDLATGKYIHFVSNNEPNIGHLDSLLATSNALFAADITSTGNVFAAPAGVIYRIVRA